MEDGAKGFIRMTNQRRIILEVLRGTKTHPTADWVYERVRQRLPNISLGTVYSNLRRLTEMGEIMELNYGRSFSRFDGNPENHYHFTCERCGAVSDIPIELQGGFDEILADAGYKVHHHRLEFYGLCPACRGQQKDSLN